VAGRILHFLPDRSEPVTRRAGCGKSARPDLWGAGEAKPPWPTRLATRPFRQAAVVDREERLNGTARGAGRWAELACWGRRRGAKADG
jgi:hypothetical protein